MMNPRQGAIYVRVSSKAQVSGESLDVQVGDCRRAAEREGVSMADDLVFREEGVSGTRATRPALDLLLQAAGDGRFTDLFVWKVSRFGRSTRNNLELLERLVELGIRVVFVRDGINSDQKMVLGMLSLVAEAESDNIKEQSSAGMKASAAKGHFMGGLPPFGTRSVSLGDDTRAHILVEDSETSDAIREAAQLMADEGASTGDIARMWNSRGFLSPRGKRWTHQNVQRVLSSPRLTGKYWWRKHRIDHPIIISADEFDGLQSALAVGRRGRRNDSRVSWLSGRIRCSCGGTLISTGRHGARGWSAPYYRCSKNLKSLGDERCTDRRYFNAETIEQEVWRGLTFLLPQSRSMASAIVDPSLLLPGLKHVDSGYAASPAAYELLRLVDDPTERRRCEDDLIAVRSTLEHRGRARSRLLVEAAKSDTHTLREAIEMVDDEIEETQRAIKELEAKAAVLSEAQYYETEFHRIVGELVEVATTDDPVIRRSVADVLDVRLYLTTGGRSALVTGSAHRSVRRLDTKFHPVGRRRSRRPPRTSQLFGPAALHGADS
jgi:DNA invertase Pin-like site-specific DNA recombinase